MELIKCKECKMEYSKDLNECPWCKTNIGYIQKKFAKKNEIDGIVFKIAISIFAFLFIYNISTKAFPMYILWWCLIGFVIFYLIIDSRICNKINIEKKELLTEEEQEQLKNYFEKKFNSINAKFLTNGRYLSGISKLFGEENCTIICTDEKICFEMKSSKKKINLPYNHILAVGTQTKTELITICKNKNVVARGIAGGLLFGGTGLLLGGLSGISPKIENMPVATNFLCIKYRTEENVEDVIIIQIDNVNRILKFLNTKLGNEENEIDL